MFKKTIILVAATVISLSSHAQFGNLLGGGGGSGPTPEKLLVEYFAGAQLVMNAQAKILDALNLKTEADNASAKAASLVTGATTDAIKEAATVQSESSRKIQEQLADKNLVLDAGAKVKIGQGYASLATGAIAYIVFIKDAKNFKPSVTSFGGAALAMVAIVPRIPDDIKNLVGTFQAVSNYAKENKIELPKDAADATAQLGALGGVGG